MKIQTPDEFGNLQHKGIIGPILPLVPELEISNLKSQKKKMIGDWERGHGPVDEYLFEQYKAYIIVLLNSKRLRV